MPTGAKNVRSWGKIGSGQPTLKTALLTLAGHIARIPRPPFRRADAAIVWTRSVLRQRFVQAALELAVEAEDARICERQDLRHDNAGNVL